MSEIQAPVVVASVLERGAAAALRAVRDAPAGCALVEVRGDLLRPGEAARVVAAAGRPTIVTVRRTCDGGLWAGSEDGRRAQLLEALDAGARLVDVEWDGPLAALADRPELAGRVVLSHHGGPCRIVELRERLARMAARGGAWLKLVPEARELDEVLALRELLAEARGAGLRLAAFASGAAGVPSRILAPAWGAWATYGSCGPGRETASGQLPARDLLELYDVLGVGRSTRLFGLVGSRVAGSPSPAMHAAGYREAGIDARYLALETADLDAALRLVDPASGLGIEALGVTLPFKEALAARCRAGDEIAAAAGAVNTVLVGPVGLVGFNTDGPAALERIRAHLDPAGARAVVLGAGGTAAAFAVALRQAGAAVTICDRTPERAAALAARTGVRAAPLGELGRKAWDVLLHATPQGSDGGRFLDPALLVGRLVLDAVYAAAPTALVRDARSRGLATVDGLELLAAQAVRQFARMTGRTARADALRAAAERWLERARS